MRACKGWSSASARGEVGSTLLVAGLVAGLFGCAAAGPSPGAERMGHSGPDAPPSTEPWVGARITLEGEGVYGLSGLGRRAAGAGYVVVPERSEKLFLIDEDGVLVSAPLSGVPSNIDMEGVAALSDGRFLLATESADAATSEALYIATQGPDGYVAGPPHLLAVDPAAGWSYQDNAGFEGVCVAGEVTLVAAEVVFVVDGRRFAPLLAFSTRDLETTADIAVAHLAVPLTSATGKISALDCRLDGDEVVVAMIERHFGIARILVARIPTRPALGAVGPVVEIEAVHDMLPLLVRDENFEGVVMLGDGRYALVNDNDYGGISGPSELVVVETRP